MGPVHVAEFEKLRLDSHAHTITSFDPFPSPLPQTSFVTLSFRSAQGNGFPGAVSAKSVCWVRWWPPGKRQLYVSATRHKSIQPAFLELLDLKCLPPLWGGRDTFLFFSFDLF